MIKGILLDTDTNKNYLRYEAMAGENITSSLETMKEVSIRRNIEVRTDFNGVSLSVTFDSNLEAVKQLYQDTLQRNSDKYNNSPEGSQ